MVHRARGWGWRLAIALLGLSLTYITWKAFLAPAHQGVSQGIVDFRIFWLAGRLWLRGRSPYDEASFQAANQQYFGHVGSDIIDPAANIFPYLPYSSLVFLPLGALSFETALRLWTLLNYLLLAGVIGLSGYLLGGDGFAKTARAPVASPQEHRLQRWRSSLWEAARTPAWTLGAAYYCTFQGTAMIFFLGQTSLLASLGGLLALAAARQPASGLPLVLGSLGVYSLVLKPQLAVVFLGALLASGRWPLLVGGGAIAGLGWLLAISRTGFTANTTDFLATLARYQTLAPNQPQRLTGIIHLLDYGGGSVGSPLLLGLGLLTGAWLGWQFRADLTRPRSLVLLVILTLLMPLHLNDLVLSGLIAIAARRWPPAAGLLLAPGLLLLWRAGNGSRLLHWYHPATEPGDANLVASVGLVLLLAGMLVILGRSRGTATS